ncbi:hypothetical protein PPYR_02991 [Photinus pyralis]|uniref:DUF4794 domain-containing protein n=1 Tax=Photinus pyralis TaxID=7054 RepID=A0A1Y1KLF6_PHOPY|nr:uncharacterized protein LOC116161813 [Photinus pyralis]KAB0791191.1 hypothetical protein PPYR_02991 [Photinus pyralis]
MNKVLPLLLVACVTYAHPTMYKLNENDKLEPDLVPVSSTVIPLPIYQVSYGVKVAHGESEKKSPVEKPEGPITLITAHSKKKVLASEKQKNNEKSTVREIKN